MSEEFIAQFVNSQIKTSGGSAEAIDTTLGKKADAAGAAVNTTNSLMANVKGIFNHLLTNLSSARMAKIDTVSTSVATINTSVTTLNTNVNTANTNINAINTNTARGAIKSIQRGTHSGSNTSVADITITISSINIGKAMVIVDASRIQGGNTTSTTYTLTPRLASMTATTLVFTPSGFSGGSNFNANSLSWQVIEFY